jgi:hypothetical protein
MAGGGVNAHGCFIGFPRSSFLKRATLLRLAEVHLPKQRVGRLSERLLGRSELPLTP